MAARPADRSTPLLTIEGLECRRGERTLFRGLGLHLDRGAIAWIRGANGQGKTTLLRTLAACRGRKPAASPGASRSRSAASSTWRTPMP
jgi:heme exporter protein A